ncbi:hypothetical protein B0J14DRAFT_653344 [Halenospora varia]|nr:hypothetical protein B0J14DRAFT_653344 [Halenospora varia]
MSDIQNDLPIKRGGAQTIPEGSQVRTPPASTQAHGYSGGTGHYNTTQQELNRPINDLNAHDLFDDEEEIEEETNPSVDNESKSSEPVIDNVENTINGVTATDEEVLFRQFSQLAAELKIKIAKAFLAISSQRIHLIHSSYTPQALGAHQDTPPAVPSALHVNRLFRQEAVKYYELISVRVPSYFSTTTRHGVALVKEQEFARKVYVNFVTDTFLKEACNWGDPIHIAVSYDEDEDEEDIIEVERTTGDAIPAKLVSEPEASYNFSDTDIFKIQNLEIITYVSQQTCKDWINPRLALTVGRDQAMEVFNRNENNEKIHLKNVKIVFGAEKNKIVGVENLPTPFGYDHHLSYPPVVAKPERKELLSRATREANEWLAAQQVNIVEYLSATKTWKRNVNHRGQKEALMIKLFSDLEKISLEWLPEKKVNKMFEAIGYLNASICAATNDCNGASADRHSSTSIPTTTINTHAAANTLYLPSGGESIEAPSVEEE